MALRRAAGQVLLLVAAAVLHSRAAALQPGRLLQGSAARGISLSSSSVTLQHTKGLTGTSVQVDVASELEWQLNTATLPACLVAQRHSASASHFTVTPRDAEACEDGWYNTSIVVQAASNASSWVPLSVQLHYATARLLASPSAASASIVPNEPRGLLSLRVTLVNAGSATADFSFSLLPEPPACPAAASPSSQGALVLPASAAAATGSDSLAPGASTTLDIPVNTSQLLGPPGAVWMTHLHVLGSTAVEALGSAACTPSVGAATALAVPITVRLGRLDPCPSSVEMWGSPGDLVLQQVGVGLLGPTLTGTTLSAAVQGGSTAPWLSVRYDSPPSGAVGTQQVLLFANVSKSFFPAGPGQYRASVRLVSQHPCSGPAPPTCTETEGFTVPVTLHVQAGGVDASQSVFQVHTPAAPAGGLATGSVTLRDAFGDLAANPAAAALRGQALLQTFLSDLEEWSSLSALSSSQALAARLSGVAQPLTPVDRATARDAARAIAAAMGQGAGLQTVPVSAQHHLVLRTPRVEGMLLYEVHVGDDPLPGGRRDTQQPLLTRECQPQAGLRPAPSGYGCLCQPGFEVNVTASLAAGWHHAADPFVDAGDAAVVAQPPASGLSLLDVLSAANPCTPCPAGTYRSGHGAPGRWNGSLALSGMLCAPCPNGTFSGPGATGCEPCPPQGARCDSGILELYSGYWTPPGAISTNSTIVKCLTFDDCLPLPEQASESVAVSRRLQAVDQPAPASNMQCRELHTGIMCRSCTLDTTVAFGQCLQCPASPVLVWLYIAGALALLFAVPAAAVLLECHHAPCGCGPARGQAADRAAWAKAAAAAEAAMREAKRARRQKAKEGRKGHRERDADAELTDEESSEEESVVGAAPSPRPGQGSFRARDGLGGTRSGRRSLRRTTVIERAKASKPRGCTGCLRSVPRAVLCCRYGARDEEAEGEGCLLCRPCCGRVACRRLGDDLVSGRHFLAVGPRNHTTYYSHTAGQLDDVLTQLRLLWQWLSGALLLITVVDVAAPVAVARAASLASGLLDALAVSVSPQVWPWACVLDEGLQGQLGQPLPAAAGNASVPVEAWADTYTSIQTSFAAPLVFACVVGGLSLLTCLLGTASVAAHVQTMLRVAVWMSPSGPQAIIDARRVAPSGTCSLPCCARDVPGNQPSHSSQKESAGSRANPHAGGPMKRSDEIPELCDTEATPPAPRASPRLLCTHLFRLPAAPNALVLGLLSMLLVAAPALRGLTVTATTLPNPIQGAEHLQYATELRVQDSERAPVLAFATAMVVLLFGLLPLGVYVALYRAHTILSRSRYRLHGPHAQFQTAWDALHAPPPSVPLRSHRRLTPGNRLETTVEPEWGDVKPNSVWRRPPLPAIPAASWYHVAYVASPVAAGLHEATSITWERYASSTRGGRSGPTVGDGGGDGHAWSMQRAGRLHRSLRAPRYWWLLLEALRPVLLASVGTVRDAQDKLLSLCMLCLFFLALHVGVWPYATTRQNLLGSWHLATWLLLCMALQYTNARDLQESVLSLARGGTGQMEAASGTSEDDSLSRDTTISILAFVTVVLSGVVTGVALLVAVVRLTCWRCVRWQYQWSITPGNGRGSPGRILFRLLCFGLSEPLRMRYPPTLQQTRAAFNRAAAKGADGAAGTETSPSLPSRAPSVAVAPAKTAPGASSSAAGAAAGADFPDLEEKSVRNPLAGLDALDSSPPPPSRPIMPLVAPRPVGGPVAVGARVPRSGPPPIGSRLRPGQGEDGDRAARTRRMSVMADDRDE